MQTPPPPRPPRFLTRKSPQESPSPSAGMPAGLEPLSERRPGPQGRRARFLELATPTCEAVEGVFEVTVPGEQSSVSRPGIPGPGSGL